MLFGVVVMFGVMVILVGIMTIATLVILVGVMMIGTVVDDW